MVTLQIWNIGAFQNVWTILPLIDHILSIEIAPGILLRDSLGETHDGCQRDI